MLKKQKGTFIIKSTRKNREAAFSHWAKWNARNSPYLNCSQCAEKDGRVIIANTFLMKSRKYKWISTSVWAGNFVGKIFNFHKNSHFTNYIFHLVVSNSNLLFQKFQNKTLSFGLDDSTKDYYNLPAFTTKPHMNEPIWKGIKVEWWA